MQTLESFKSLEAPAFRDFKSLSGFYKPQDAMHSVQYEQL